MTAIEFENISKQYRLGLVSTKTLAHDITRFWQTRILRHEDPYLKIGEANDRSTKGNSDYVWALRDINFKVEQGDVVGIIGKNGAGKSTLLKLLSQVTGPTTGTIRARGRIGSLLEVGTGFHQEMTGRENIYLNGAILGMTRQEISRKLDEIVDFSGCERYIDTPVKRYSSGMMVRLGFAVAAHLDPEILVVDEVLAVGDAEFQKKAIGKMQDVSKGEGRTVLFVSHVLSSVRTLCNQGIVLDKGTIFFKGLAEEAIDTYLNMDKVSFCDENHYDVRIYNKNLKINKVSINEGDTNVLTLCDKKSVTITIEGKTAIPLNLALEIHIYCEDGSQVGTYSPAEWEGRQYLNVLGDFTIKETVELPETLCNGAYYMNANIIQLYVENLATITNLVKFTVTDFSSSITGAMFNNKYFGNIMLH
ncbi:MAG: ABC transporter ATP-binding protein [Paludibacteraceae bacterium]|nr:ABC transporter ATP-binding protein [Paludibacteraceae bacterium]